MPQRRPPSRVWARERGVSARPGPILGLAIMPEARPGLVHRRLPAAADPQRLGALIRHRPGIAGDAGIGARRVDLEQIREPATEPDHYAAVMAPWPPQEVVVVAAD